MTVGDSHAIRAFISYSWSSPTHESWVIELATRLRTDGVDVVLDKWDLRPGHDAISFMESMVTDPAVTKVIIVCDKTYSEKADGRAGGVGTESQIISPLIYESATQNKFAAVITELDDGGKPYVPTYYKGKVYIDFTIPDKSEGAYDELLRWLVDKPQHVKPKLGQVPPHILDPEAVATTTASKAKRSENAIRRSDANGSGFLREYCDALIGEMPEFYLDKTDYQFFDDGVVEAIDRFRPYAAEFQDIVVAIARFSDDGRLFEVIVRTLEQAGCFMYRPAHISSWSTDQFDHFKVISHDLFLSTMAIVIREERFDLALQLVAKPYLIRNDSEGGGQRRTKDFTVFREPVESLARRNERLKLNRLSLHADLIERWYKGKMLSFEDVMQADFLLYLISCSGDMQTSMSDRWYPTSLVFAVHRYSPFPIFARAESREFFSRISNLLRAESLQAFKSRLENLAARDQALRFDYRGLAVGVLANEKHLGSIP